MNARQRRKLRRAVGRHVGYDPQATMLVYLDWRLEVAKRRGCYRWGRTVSQVSQRRDELLRALSPDLSPEAFKARRARKATFKYPRWVVPVPPGR